MYNNLLNQIQLRTSDSKVTYVRFSEAQRLILSPGVYLKMLIAIGQALIIVMTFLPFVDSLVYRTASYSGSLADQFFEIKKGE